MLSEAKSRYGGKDDRSGGDPSISVFRSFEEGLVHFRLPGGSPKRRFCRIEEGITSI